MLHGLEELQGLVDITFLSHVQFNKFKYSIFLLAVLLNIKIRVLV
jgi:hypothetical protein